MANTVDKVLKIAETEVGYLEKKTNSQLDSKTANAGMNNYTKYWRDMNASGYQGQPWCNCWVNWCFVKAYGESVAKKLLCTDGAWSYYTPTSAGYFKSKSQWHTSSPKSGDVIYFKDANGGICHVGLVYKVDSTYVYTMEGNTSGGSTVVANGGGVAKKQYALNYSRIAGYGRPKYDAEPKPSTNAKITDNCNFYKKKNTWDGFYKALIPGAKINVTSDCGDGWSKVKIGDNTGYVKNSCIALDSKKVLSDYPTKKTTKEVVFRSDRKVADSTKIKTLKAGTSFKAICKGGDWVQTKINGKLGYLWLEKTNA